MHKTKFHSESWDVNQAFLSFIFVFNTHAQLFAFNLQYVNNWRLASFYTTILQVFNIIILSFCSKNNLLALSGVSVSDDFRFNAFNVIYSQIPHYPA